MIPGDDGHDDAGARGEHRGAEEQSEPQQYRHLVNTTQVGYGYCEDASQYRYDNREICMELCI